MSPETTTSSLRDAYAHCRTVTAEHGRSYYLATRLLPPGRRPAVHALYAFAREVDDLVDLAPDGHTAKEIAAAIDRTEDRLRAALSGRATGGHVLPALVDTIDRYSIPTDYFTAFLHSMRMDVTGDETALTRYATMEHLRAYMYGSAAVIGLQLLPVLGTVVPTAEAEPAAAALGEAFQLTNFLRDVGEDLDRGRVYLPADTLEAFGVDLPMLRRCRTTGDVPERPVKRALAHVIAQTRAVYRTAEPGIAMLEPRARPCVRTAFDAYSMILEEIERSGYRVFDRRAVVPARRRVTAAARSLLTR